MTYFVGIGNPFVDRFALVTDDFLQENNLVKNTTTVVNNKDFLESSWKNIRHQSGFILGGSCTNIIKALACLDQKTRLIGKIGAGHLGKSLLKSLQCLGVTTFLSEASIENGIVNCFITPDKKRTMLTYLGSSIELSKDDILRAEKGFLDAGDVILEGYLAYYPETVMDLSIQLAKKNRARISLDLSSVKITDNHLMHAQFISWVQQVDLVFGNLQEMQGLTRTQGVDEIVKSPAFHDNQIVLITNGGDSCWIKEPFQRKATMITLKKVDNVIDTTGAGDFFIAGFLDALKKEEPLIKCVERGHLVASYVIQQIGTALSEQTWSLIKEKK